MSQKDDIIKYLRHVGDDFIPEEPDVSTCPECSTQEDNDGCCPKHTDCGICRYEYMKLKGWLSTNV